MKIAVSGKGGVGKSTFTSLLCKSYQQAGYKVLALDADPDANLAATLGVPSHESIVPIVDMKELIFERTGSEPGSMGAFFKINPKVDDIPERFSVTHNGIRLLVMGLVKTAGTGCYCPENAFIKELVGHLLLEDEEVVILDMEAGIEHLGRGTTGDVDAFIIVVEPGKRSIETAKRVATLAGELGVKKYHVVVNKVNDDEDLEFVKSFFEDDTVVGAIPYSRTISLSGRGDDGVELEDMTLIDNIRIKIEKGK